MKKWIAIFSAVNCSLLSMQTEKGWDKCHYAVYGRAVKTMAYDQQNETITEGTVPLQHIGPLREIKFNPHTYTFTVEHTGTYVIEYFIEGFDAHDVEESDILGVAIKINSKLIGARSLVPQRVYDSACSFYTANMTLTENLNKKDKVSLVFTKVTQTPYFANKYTSDDIPPATVAYLSIHKAETNR